MAKKHYKGKRNYTKKPVTPTVTTENENKTPNAVEVHEIIDMYCELHNRRFKEHNPIKVNRDGMTLNLKYENGFPAYKIVINDEGIITGFVPTCTKLTTENRFFMYLNGLIYNQTVVYLDEEAI